MKKFLEICNDLFKNNFNKKEVQYFFELIADGDLDSFKNLLKKKNKYFTKESAISLFKEACYHNDLDIVKYLLESPHTIVFHDLHLTKKDWIEEACEKGNRKVIEYIFNLPEIKSHPYLNKMVNIGLHNSCKNGHLELVRFFTSGDLKKYANIDETFKTAFTNKDIDIMQYFIFEMNIQKSQAIMIHVAAHTAVLKIPGLNVDDMSDITEQMNSMFSKRDLMMELNNELAPKNDNTSTVKKNKI